MTNLLHSFLHRLVREEGIAVPVEMPDSLSGVGESAESGAPKRKRATARQCNRSGGSSGVNAAPMHAGTDCQADNPCGDLSTTLRPDLRVIADMIPSGTTVPGSGVRRRRSAGVSV